MNIVCAGSVLHGDALFSPLGKVTLLPDEALTPQALRAPDAPFTRTKTRVTRELIAGTPVRFVGTATAGTDHVDIPALAALGVTFVSAPGCNAPSVADYVTAALLTLETDLDWPLPGKTLGIVGCGQVGDRVAQRARALGMRVLRNDPPREARGDRGFTDLDTLLAASDAVSLHVPLVEAGPWPTRSLIGAEEIARMKPGVVLFNTCRGEALDPDALGDAIDRGHVRAAVLDVWPAEPDTPPELLDRAHLGSAHIAGHSWEGKFNGTRMNLESCCRFFERDIPEPDPALFPPAPRIDAPVHTLLEAVRAVYDIREDDRLLRAGLAAAAPAERKDVFRTLRRAYRVRREFSAATLTRWRGSETDREKLCQLGFSFE